MKESVPFVRRKRTNNIKLVVSFNGAFRRRPPSGRLRYTGGEAKIISVDRSVSFSRLKSRVSEILEQSNGVVPTSPFSLKYHLPDSQEERPLNSVSSDDDVSSMFEEFEWLEFLGKPTRLWIFVCFECDEIGFSCFSDNGFFQKKLVFSGKNKTGDEGLGGQNLVPREKGNRKSCDNSLRKIVLKQQWLGKRSDRLRDFTGEIAKNEMKFMSENESSEHPVIDISSKSKSTSCIDRNDHLVEEKHFKKVSIPPVSKSLPLNPKDGNLSLRLNCLSNDLSGQAQKPSPMFDIGVDSVLCNVNRENIMPFNVKGERERNRFSSLSSSQHIDGSGNSSRVVVGKHELIRFYQFGSSEIRNLRIHPYQTKARAIFSEMYYLGMRLSRNISKQLPVSYLQRIKDVEGKMNQDINEYRSCQELTGSSSVDASLNNLSLSSSSLKVELQSSVETQSKDMNASQKLNDGIEENSPTNLSTDEKDENTETNKCAKLNGVVPADVALYCADVGNRGLQRILKSELEYIKELGSGTYGTVYYGKWKGSDVAIKKLKPSCFTEGTVDDRLVADFWKEAHILGQLHHPNIVALYGVVTDGPVNNLATVTEYMVNGSLKQVLRKRDRTIDCRKRLIIAMDAAFGMEYLHQKNVVHFDLKSHNFLVNMRDPQRPVCKIGDLGLSKIKQRTLVSGGVRGTIPWMAPELLKGENMVSEKVDVYSFGIVMWELLTGEEPYSSMRAEEIICGIIKGSLRPEIPNWCNPSWRSLMEKCWSSDPKERPDFSGIAMELRAMASALNIK